VITFPSNNATGLPLTFDVQANAYTGAGSATVEWRPVGGSYNAINRSVQEGAGAYNLAVSGLALATAYDLRVRAYDGANATGTILAETTLRITTTANPQFISPANGDIVPSSFTVQIGAHPTAASMILQVFRVGGGIVSQINSLAQDLRFIHYQWACSSTQ
jgi:hypothetical protein